MGSRQIPGLDTLIKFLLVVSGVLVLLCAASLQFGILLDNVLQRGILWSIYDVVGFIFFATTLAGTWFNVLDRRLTAVLLLVFAVREFNRLESQERTFILVCTVIVVFLGYALPLFMKKSSYSASSTSSPSSPTPSSSSGPVSPDLSQPADSLERADRIEGFQAFGDLLPQALKKRPKKQG